MRPLQRGSMDATLGPKPRGAIATRPLEKRHAGTAAFRQMKLCGASSWLDCCEGSPHQAAGRYQAAILAVSPHRPENGQLHLVTQTFVCETHMKLGFARVSKADGSQTLDLQMDALAAAGVLPDQVYSDEASGKRDDRPGLEACLKALRSGDTLYTWKLDRLGHDLKHLVTTVRGLSHRGVGLSVLTGQGSRGAAMPGARYQPRHSISLCRSGRCAPRPRPQGIGTLRWRRSPTKNWKRYRTDSIRARSSMR